MNTVHILSGVEIHENAQLGGMFKTTSVAFMDFIDPLLNRRPFAALSREEGDPWVIRGRKPGERLKNIDSVWRSDRARAGIDDVRLHDLRHSFASRAMALGESLPMIGRLLGHSWIETTARYVHLAHDTAHEAAERVAASIEEDIL